jgi:hypothetical protein
MKVLTSILTACATVALLVPVAAEAAGAKSSPQRISAAHAYTALNGTGKSKAAKSKKSNGKSSKRVVPIVIVGVAAGGSVGVAADVDECLTSMVNCTDEQYCLVWGFNCGLLGTGGTTAGAQTTAASPATSVSASAPAASPADATSAGAATPAETPTVVNTPNQLAPQWCTAYGDYQAC